MEGKLERKRIHILQSENDNRLYRGLELVNGIKVLLISDPTTEKCAAAMDVGVGSKIDPPEIPGLARLFQRVLYLTYEDTQQRFFKNYVKNNDGMVNAETHWRTSNYYFEINPSKFQDAFPSFAEFFIKPPVFSKNVIQKEVSNVTRELETIKSDEKCETIEFIKWIRCHHEGLPEPETKKLIKTAKTNLVNMLEMIYTDFYYAGNMKLCVLSKESLDDLEELVVDLFGVMTTNLPSLSDDEHRSIPLCSSVNKICYVPHGAYNRLDVIFYLDYKMSQYYEIDRFISYLFQYDRRGSLLSVLKARDWGNSIKAGPFPELYETVTFVISIDLTEEGLEHVDDIMTLYFQYVDMLKENNGLRRVYNEYKEMQELNFRFKEKESPLTYVKHISRMMYQSQLKHVLRGIYMPTKWKLKSVQTVLAGILSPLRMNVYVGSKKFENAIHSPEPCDNYKYKIDEVPAKTCARWTKIRHLKNFDLPPRNEFIPTSLRVKPHENKVKKHPMIIKKTKLLKIWHKKDDKFNVARATMMFHFLSPVAYKDPVNVYFTCMFVRLINNSLSDYVHPASLAGLHWEICPTPKGIQLKIYGFDNKQRELMEKIVDRIIKFKLSPKNFEVFRQKSINVSLKELEKFQSDLPLPQAQYYLSLFLTAGLYHKEHILRSCHNVNFERLYEFILVFFDTMYVEGLIHGNVTTAEALDIAHFIESKVSRATPLSIEKLYRDVRLKKGAHIILHKENTFHLNSCTLVYYQVERRTTKWDVLLDFIVEIIKTPCKTLEKKGNLDYIAHAGAYRSHGMQGLTISVQGQKSYTHKHVEKNIVTFVHSMKNYIAKLSKELFEKTKTSMIKTCGAKRPKTLNEISDVFWNEILKQERNFDQSKVEIDVIHKITLYDISSFFKELVDKKTPKVSIYVTSVKDASGRKDKSVPISRNYAEEIEDILLLRNSQNLCSVPYLLKVYRK